MAHVDGRVFWEAEMPASNPAERAAVYDAMNATLARLHTYEPAAIGLGDYGRGENYVGRQIERWSKQYRASETEKIEEMERLMDWLPAHVPPPQPPRLVHGDYRLDNMIVAPDSPKVLAVLDWELSTLGDPLADFSYHLMQWHMPPSEAGTGSLIGFDLAALGIPALDDYIEAYVTAHRARSPSLSGGLLGLQFLPHRRDPAGHRRPRARRHRHQRGRRRQSRAGSPACHKSVGICAPGRRLT